jgi:hypothetical protein
MDIQVQPKYTHKRASVLTNRALDALAIAISYHVGLMVIDEETAEESFILEQKLAAAEAFLNKITDYLITCQYDCRSVSTKMIDSQAPISSDSYFSNLL